MRPTLLRPGMKVVCGGRVMTFLRREKSRLPGNAINWFQCDDFRGLDGPTDEGTCTMNDARVARWVYLHKEAA